MEEGIQYLLEACIKLGCSRITQVRAMLLYHHFMSCQTKYNSAMVAAICLSLSSNISEEVVDTDTLVLMFYCIVNKTEEVLDTDDTTFANLKKSFVTHHYLITRILEFTLTHSLAHQYLLPFIELVFARSSKISNHHSAVSEASLALMTDFYTVRKCLDYKPEHIAIGCIDLAIHMHGMDGDTEILDPWYEGLCDDLTPEKVKQLKCDILCTYKKDAPQIVKAASQAEMTLRAEKALQRERAIQSEMALQPERAFMSDVELQAEMRQQEDEQSEKTVQPVVEDELSPNVVTLPPEKAHSPVPTAASDTDVVEFGDEVTVEKVQPKGRVIEEITID